MDSAQCYVGINGRLGRLEDQFLFNLFHVCQYQMFYAP